MKLNVFKTIILDFVQCPHLLKRLHFGKWKWNQLPKHTGLNKPGQWLPSKAVLINSDNRQGQE
jgi:hypothetical protein